jgi:ribonuclease G
MEIKTAETIPTKSGTDAEVGPTILLVDEIENHVLRVLDEKGGLAEVKVHPFVAAYFERHRWKYQINWFFKHKKWVKILSRTAYPLMQYKLLSKAGEEIVSSNQ